MPSPATLPLRRGCILSLGLGRASSSLWAPPSHPVKHNTDSARLGLVYKLNTNPIIIEGSHTIRTPEGFGKLICLASLFCRHVHINSVAHMELSIG